MPEKLVLDFGPCDLTYNSVPLGTAVTIRAETQDLPCLGNTLMGLPIERPSGQTVRSLRTKRFTKKFRNQLNRR